MTKEALNIAGQCRATASSSLAKNILVDGGNGLLTELLLDAAMVIEALAQTQEPVALPTDEYFVTWSEQFGGIGFKESMPNANYKITVTAVPQRTWVGLSDDEIDLCFEDHGWSPSEDYYPVIKDIEAKLKQKNGYAEENT